MRLYKYRRFDEHLWDILRDNKLYFASPEELNDPFDCRPRVVVGDTREGIGAHVRELAYRLGSALDDETRKTAVEEAIRRFESPEEVQRLYYSKVVGSYGILSLSADCRHPLLWAHYADNHRGLCLEFEFPRAGVCPVQYTEDRPVVDVVAANDANRADELFTSGLLTKSTEWAYEQEYRITRGKGSGLVPFPPQALTGVILGGRASRKNKKAVVELLSKRPLPVRLLRVVFEEESFALHLEEV